MVRRVNRIIGRGGARYYVLSCGHEILATDYRYELNKKTGIARPFKPSAFCSVCWTVERGRPYVESAK